VTIAVIVVIELHSVGFSWSMVEAVDVLLRLDAATTFDAVSPTATTRISRDAPVRAR
jgi:hypothetical protein